MSKRERLPNRRGAETISYYCRGQKIDATLGFFPDGRLGEAFIRSGKAGTDLSISMIEVAVAVSMALQHGCDIDTLREAMPRTEDGKAEGAVGQLLDMLAKPRLEAVT